MHDGSGVDPVDVETSGTRSEQDLICGQPDRIENDPTLGTVEGMGGEFDAMGRGKDRPFPNAGEGFVEKDHVRHAWRSSG